jgi:hypothetical protein
MNEIRPQRPLKQATCHLFAMISIAASASACVQEELPGDETAAELGAAVSPEQPDELADSGDEASARMIECMAKSGRDGPEDCPGIDSEVTSARDIHLDSVSFQTYNYAASIYNSGSSQQRFLTGDFDDDAKTDVFQTYRGWGSIPVCRSTGAGWSCSNLAATIYNSGSGEQQFLTGDFNSDGKADVFQTYRGWGSIPVCRSTGAGWSCSNPAATIYDSGSSQQRFLTGDFDDDAKTDVFQTYRGWGSIPVCRSTGTGWSCSNPAATIYNSGSGEQRFSTGDFDNDGKADVFQTYRGWGSIPVCRSTGAGWSCSNPAATIYNSGSSEQQFLTGDFNGDGKTDVFQTYRGWGSIPVCRSTGTGWSCSNLAATIYNSGSSEQRFMATDLNGDGLTDIVQTYRGWQSYPVCLSTGSGWDCANVSAAIFNSGSSEQQFLTGDFNDDGREDLFQTYRGWGSIPTSITMM